MPTYTIDSTTLRQMMRLCQLIEDSASSDTLNENREREIERTAQELKDQLSLIKQGK